MDERTRLAYLDAMGIESYFPIFRLPGAKPSERCATAVAVQPQRRRAQPAESETPAAPVRARKAPDFGDLLEPESKPPSRSPAPASTPPRESVLRFELRLIHSDCGFLVVDSDSAQVPEGRLLRFVSNLLLAVTRQRQIRLSTTVFRWPMADNPLLGSGEAAAREALQASIAANAERHGVQRLLLMGESAQTRLSGVAEQLSLPAISLPAVERIFREPELKPVVWKTLRDGLV